MMKKILVTLIFGIPSLLSTVSCWCPTRAFDTTTTTKTLSVPLSKYFQLRQTPHRRQQRVLVYPSISQISRLRCKDLFAPQTSQRSLSLSSVTTSGSDEAAIHVTLSYSFNFCRHIIRDARTKRVLESFAWLDEALERYPDAEMLPLCIHTSLTTVPEMMIAGCGCSNASSSNNNSDDDEDGNKEDYDLNKCYPLEKEIRQGCNESEEKNLDCIKQVLLNDLKWFPRQTETLFQAVPHLNYVPGHVFQERISFLLSPLGSSSIYANKDPKDVDWPLLLDRGYGAGLSVAQASHALQSVPQMLLRFGSLFRRPLHNRTVQNSNDNNKNDRKKPDGGVEGGDYLSSEQLQMLYEQTPPLVLDIAKRQLDPHLTGTRHTDTVVLAFLHFKGWEWSTSRTIIEALPQILQASTEPSWEHYLVAQRKTTNSLLLTSRSWDTEALEYLQRRLQIAPWQLHAMIKTHPTISKYSLSLIHAHIDSLQSQLSLNSSQVRSIMLRMSSILGTSPKSLRERVSFWSHSVGLPLSSLQQLALEFPAALQYSVKENLIPKLFFFRTRLKLDQNQILYMTKQKPTIWGRSLTGRLEPMCAYFCEVTNMTETEFGRLIARVPAILLFNVKTLDGKIAYLRDTLRLTKEAQRDLLLSSPWLLCHSISAISSKLELLEQFVDSHQAVQRNPSLLLNSRSSLEKRLAKVTSDNSTSKMSALTGRRSRGANHKTVVLLPIPLSSNGNDTYHPSESSSYSSANNTFTTAASVSKNPFAVIEREFSSASKAAEYAKTSLSTMYRALRLRRPLQGRQYFYARDLEEATTLPVAESVSTVAPAADTQKTALADSRPEEQLNRIKESVLPIDAQRSDNSNNVTIRDLTIYCTGRAYPQEKEIRGGRRAGGMALTIEDWTPRQWETCEALWHGQRVKLHCSTNDRKQGGGDEKLPTDCVLLWGYPYTRPSRPRCSLYVFRQALRIAREWIQQETKKDMESKILLPVMYDIKLVTDSCYVYELLKNSSQVLEWGRQQDTSDGNTNDLRDDSYSRVMLDGPFPAYRSNLDILYPLAQTWLHMVYPQKPQGAIKITSALLRELQYRRLQRVLIRVDFQSPTTTTVSSSSNKEMQSVNMARLSQGALVAARRMYEQAL